MEKNNLQDIALIVSITGLAINIALLVIRIAIL